MWLNDDRLRQVDATSRFRANFNELFPNGARITVKKCVQLERHARVNEHELSWNTAAAVLLTQAGYDKFMTQQRALDVANYVARFSGVDAVRGRYHTALARWRRQHNINTNRITHAQQVERDEIERRYQDGKRRVIMLMTVPHARLFGELAEDNARNIVAAKPKNVQLRDGDVLVTANTLRQLGSCQGYVDLFRRNWPNGTVITPELCVKHYEQFEWGWAANNLLALDHFSIWERRTYDRMDALGLMRSKESQKHRRDVSELIRQRDANELSLPDYDAKRAVELDRHMKERRRIELEQMVIYARTFGELYMEHPNPRLPQLG